MKTINSHTRDCKSTQGGVSKFYLIPYVRHAYKLIEYDGDTLTVFPASNANEYDCSGTYNQDSDYDSGSQFFNHKANINLIDGYRKHDITYFTDQDYRIIVLNNNGDHFMLGSYNGVRGKISNSSGGGKNDFSGVTINFEGKEETPILYISDLSALGITII